MGSISVLFLVSMFLLAVDLKAQQNHSNVIPLGSWLSPIANRTSWLSPSDLFSFGFYPQGRKGFAMEYGCMLNQRTLLAQNLLIQLMHDSGNFFLYNNSSHVIWQSFDNPTDTILGGQNLSNGDELIYRAILDSDGIFKLYSHHFWGHSNTSSNVSLEWPSLHDQCEVRFLWLNSYCTGTGSKAECHCYPVFHFMNPKNKLLGCYKNFSEDGCSKGPMIHYNITASPNISWGDFPYSVQLINQENCYKSCLGDCTCGAAFYFYVNGTCNKFKLPLRYGRSQNLSVIAFFKVIQRSVHRYRELSPENVNVEFAENFSLHSFSYNELENATDGFKENGFKEVLGEGSFGSVYKGYVSEANKTIVVKRLEKLVEEGEREFQAEMTAIGRTHHRNLVQLLGFCIEGSRKLLVYEYISNGSLADLLFKAKKRPIWKERVRIILEVARGVFYLHQECKVHIIHCNLKPQNILMDDTRTAKISDFWIGEAIWTSEYSAPEWQKKSLISVKADIYSFGVLLLEIVCCRGSIEVNVLTTDEILLSNWVYNCFVAGQLDKLVEDEIVGLWCIQEDPALRPPMKNVILMLEGTVDIAVPPSPAISHS
ncbi:hypothetical protein ACB092_12G173100 [Castanea dentata]